MRRRVLFIVIFLLLTMLLPAQRRDIHILAVNDMHASLGAMPQLAAIADSLRTLYPSLLVFSAGDNRTGNPYNDLYKPSGYPMVALMNQIGFSASALGNHEFDGHSLAPLCPLSAFPYLCANITADDSTGVHTHPYKLFDVDGLKVAVIGIVQVSRQGTPNTHPDGIRGLHFESPHEVIRRYEWLSQQCDATILLSHNGYENDVRASKDYPWIDLIIGGHSHRQLSDTIIGPFSYSSSLPVLITQNRNQLSNVTHITLTVDSGHVVSKSAEYINVRSFRQKNKIVEAMVDFFDTNPYFHRVLATAETPFVNRNEVGTMLCDAMRSATGADVALMNYRGIRVNSMKAGDITVGNVLEIDPFHNHAVMTTMTGAELERFILDYSRMSINHFPHLSGMSADLLIANDEPSTIQKVTLLTADGQKPFDRKKTYRVVTNSYVIAKGGKYAPTATRELPETTSDMLTSYLEQQHTVSYQGKGSLHYIHTQ